MRIAWFRTTAPDAADPLDDTAVLIDALRATHDLDVIVEADAHDFVWRHALKPWDLCVYELDGGEAHQFEWGYLLNYPGVVLLKSSDVQSTAGTAISHEGRLDEYMTGLDIDRLGSGVASLRIPLLASRSVVVQHTGLAQSLQARYPAARIRCAPIGVREPAGIDTARTSAGILVVGAPGRQRLEGVARAVERVRAAGQNVELLSNGSSEDIVGGSDVIVALAWPPHDAPLTGAWAGLAAGKPVVTLELEATATWPAIDPQSWRPRGLVAIDVPVAVTLDPLDEEHSLTLALLRLATDPVLRSELGRAGHAWWLAHATPAHAAAAWLNILKEASTVSPPARPSDWPPHLDADGTELARDILKECGVDRGQRSQS